MAGPSRSRRFSRRTGAAAALLIGVSAAATVLPPTAEAADPTRYTVTVVRPVGGETFGTSGGNPVNGAGLVAGYVSHGISDHYDAAVLDLRTSRVRSLGDFGGGHYAVATDVNIRGDVVGDAYAADGSEHAFIVRAGTSTLQDLDPTVGPRLQTVAAAINDRGVVAGAVLNADGLGSAATWTVHPDGSTTRSDIGKALDVEGSTAAAINNGGYVLVNEFSDSGNRSVVWFPSKHYALPIAALPGDKGTIMNDINDAGYAVGESFAPSGLTDPYGHPMLWSTQGRANRRLPAPTELAGNRAVTIRPIAINHAGDVVGTAYPAGGGRAVVWGPHGSSVASLPLPGPDAQTQAAGINVYGQIVGTVGAQTFVWNRVPVSS